MTLGVGVRLFPLSRGIWSLLRLGCSAAPCSDFWYCVDHDGGIWPPLFAGRGSIPDPDFGCPSMSDLAFFLYLGLLLVVSPAMG